MAEISDETSTEMAEISVAPAGAACFHPVCRRHLKRGQENFCEGFFEVAIQARTLVASVTAGLATLKPISLAWGRANAPRAVHTVDALPPTLVEQEAAASGPPDARNCARPAITGSQGAPLPG